MYPLIITNKQHNGGVISFQMHIQSALGGIEAYS